MRTIEISMAVVFLFVVIPVMIGEFIRVGRVGRPRVMNPIRNDVKEWYSKEAINHTIKVLGLRGRGRR